MIKLTMTYTKSTPGTHVYKSDEPTDQITVPTVYIKRDKLPNKPKQIEVTINEQS